jgi:hypothetical protein
LIAKALTRNAVLQALDVSDNSIRAAGLQAFVDCLQYNHSLSSIMTIGNPGFESDKRAEDIVRMRMEAGVQVMDHHERTGQLEYKVGYTASLSKEHVGYAATGQAPPTPNTQAVLDGLADMGRGHTPLPASLAVQTPPGSRAQARSRGAPVTGMTPPGSAERAGSRGGGSRGRRRDAQVLCVFSPTPLSTEKAASRTALHCTALTSLYLLTLRPHSRPHSRHFDSTRLDSTKNSLPWGLLA